MKVFCTYCGAANAPDAQICTNCASAMDGPGAARNAAATGPLAPETSPAPARPANEPQQRSPWDPISSYIPQDPPPLYGAEAPPLGLQGGAPPPFAAWPPAPTSKQWPSYPPAGQGTWSDPAAGMSHVPQQPHEPHGPPMRDAYGRPLPPNGQPSAYWPAPAYGQPPAYGHMPAPYNATPPAYPGAPGYAQVPAHPQPPQGIGYSWAAYANGAYPFAPAPPPPGSLSAALPRFGAYLFDAVMFMVLAMVVLTVTAAVGLANISLLVLLGLHAAYHIGFWATSGRTPGYKAAGLQMIKSDGSKPGIGTASIRYIGWLISPFVLYLNCLWMLWDARKQTWHDKMANTVVIKA